MSNITLTDIKQLLDAMESRLDSKIDSKIEELRQEMHDLRQELRQEMHEGFRFIGDKVTEINDVLGNHERRIVRLEKPRKPFKLQTGKSL